ncbi:ABC transporter permease [Paenibacillus elgii]|nr:iron ABC transporter permease [Paenibacillus elgii]
MNRFKEALFSGKIIGIIIAALLVWFIVAFLVYPNLNLLIATFFSDGSFSVKPFQKLLHSTRALKSLLNSFVLAVSLVVTVNVVGIFLVLVTEYYEIKGAKLLRLGYMTTLIYSGIVLVFGYKFVYGEGGIITKILVQLFPHLNPAWFTGYWAVLYVMTFAITSNHVIFLSNAIKKIDYQTIEAARNMGASSFYILRRVVFPVLKPTLFAVTVLLFLTGLSATSAPLVLGGRDFQTITPMILTFVQSLTSRDMASLLAMILGAFTWILLSILRKVEKDGNYISISKVKSQIVKQKINSKLANIMVHGLAYLLFGIYALPVILIVIFSFTDNYSIITATLSFDRFTFANYARLFTHFSDFKPYGVSILYSSVSSILVVILALIVSRILHKYKNIFSTVLEYAMLIPWLLPSTLIALGLIITYDSPKLIMLNQVLTGSVYILLIAYVIVQIPFTLRMLRAAFFTVDRSLEDASQSLGAGPFYTFRRVLLPILLPSTLAVLAMNFNGHLADYDLAVFLYHPIMQPLGIVIKNSTSEQASGDVQALVLVFSVILMVLSSITLYLVYGRKSKE